MKEVVAEYIRSINGKVLDVKRRPVFEKRKPGDWDAQQCSTMDVAVEQVYIVEIPERELDQISHMRDYYRRNMQGFDIDRFDRIIKNDLHEKHLRETDPRLNELYEQYRVMLALIDNREYNQK